MLRQAGVPLSVRGAKNYHAVIHVVLCPRKRRRWLLYYQSATMEFEDCRGYQGKQRDVPPRVKRQVTINVSD